MRKILEPPMLTLFDIVKARHDPDKISPHFSIPTIEPVSLQRPRARVMVKNVAELVERLWLEKVLLFGQASERPELATARIVVAGGRGVSAKHFVWLERIAEHLNAALGATRAAIDAGCISEDAQIGQTGKTVAPDLYLALGISGAMQHVAGMSASRVIAVINHDEQAPIFAIADYGLIADLAVVLPVLESEILKRK